MASAGDLKAMVLLGTRPEAIKLAPVVLALRAHPGASAWVTVTGQHTELVRQVLDVFAIAPDHDLAVGRQGQTLSGLVARMLPALESALTTRRPDVVIVQGDTTTALAGGLAAFHERIPVVHVEAGLRTGDRSSPFPEEMNRRLITGLASLHLTSTLEAKANLLAERIDPSTVLCTGNTVIDALRHALAELDAGRGGAGLPALEAAGRRVLLVTVHRRESWGPPMAGIARALARLAADDPGILVVVPLHPNPVVRRTLEPELAGHDNVRLVEPLSYLELVRLLRASYMVLTDSGGIQEEAPSLGKPVLVLRDTTERPEGVAAGSALLVGTDPDAIVAASRRLLDDPSAHASMSRVVDVYGDGLAAGRIVDAVSWLLRGTPRPREFEPTAS